MKVKVSRCLNNGEPRFKVSWTPPGGKRRRQFYRTRPEAEAERDEIIRQHRTAGEVWLTLAPSDRAALAGLISRAINGGYTLTEAVEFYEKNHSSLVSATLGEAYAAYLTEKVAMRLSRKTLNNTRTTLGRFISGQESAPVGMVTRDAILAWLSPFKAPRTWNSFLTILKTFFKWCVRTEKIAKSPAASIALISPRRMPDIDEPPAILTVPQCRALLTATLRSDKRLVPYVALCLFAGLRPLREAAEIKWQDIGEDELTVRGLTAKDRQARHIPIHPTLRAWLDLGGDLPVKNLRRRFELARKKARLFDSWVQDVMRHTFASHYLPVFGGEATIAAMGHGDFQMLFRHYRALITKAQADEFWKLTPDTCT